MSLIRGIVIRALADARAQAALESLIEGALGLCQLARPVPPRWHAHARRRVRHTEGWGQLHSHIEAAGVHVSRPWWPRELLLASPVERAAMHIMAAALFGRAAVKP